mgnify:CR=1 FL=1
MVKILNYITLFFVVTCVSLAQEVKTNDTISAGDTVLLTINGEPQISGQFLVSNDNDIAHALLGKIKTADKSSNDLAQDVTKLLQDGYILKPSVSVSIIDQKPYQVRIIGEVTKPGEIVYPRNKTMDLGSAIGLVGNMTEEADEKAITLDRNGSLTKISLSGLGATMLKDGDIVRIGKLPDLGTFSISGEVVKAGTYVIPREKEGKLTIFAAISIAGGPTKVAKLSKTIVTRNSATGKSSSTTVNASDRSKVFYVRPGDEIEVKARIF